MRRGTLGFGAARAGDRVQDAFKGAGRASACGSGRKGRGDYGRGSRPVARVRGRRRRETTLTSGSGGAARRGRRVRLCGRCGLVERRASGPARDGPCGAGPSRRVWDRAGPAGRGRGKGDGPGRGWVGLDIGFGFALGFFFLFYFYFYSISHSSSTI